MHFKLVVLNMVLPDYQMKEKFHFLVWEIDNTCQQHRINVIIKIHRDKGICTAFFFFLFLKTN